MDIKIEKKKGIRKKHLPYLAGGLLVVATACWAIFGNHSSSYKADIRTLTIGEAVYGEFNDYIRVSGQVQPISTIQLSPLEGGIVEEIVIEEGLMVRKGDVIVRLSNNNLNMSILNTEAQLAEKENILRNTLLSMEQEKLNIRQEILQLELDVNRKKRTYLQHEELHKEKLISLEDYLQSKENWELAAKKMELFYERQIQDSIYRSVQVKQLQESLEVMKLNMIMSRERMDNLQVRSPIAGELGLLDAVLGQSVSGGMRIGQINDLSDYKVEAMLDEHYIDRVTTGLHAILERQSVPYHLIVKKVYPEVRNGQFRTDLVFEDSRPENMRTGQTYYLDLKLGEPAQAVMIPRGSFYSSTGGAWIFVVAPDGKKAHKRSIRISRQNPQFYEVTEGLEPGEKVIVSGYEAFGNNEIIILD